MTQNTLEQNTSLKTQMSDTFLNAIFLTMSGGFQDAYTYFCRGKVFANAQTGNIVFMGSYLSKGQWMAALRYAIPVLSFMAGTFIAELIHKQCKHMQRLHWRQLILLGEILLFLVVGLLPQSLNIPANALVSFVCAMQVQSFRKVDGYTYASTMCIGNMRSATEALCIYVHSKDRTILRKSLKYYGIILLFAVGAGIGSIITGIYAEHAIWLCCLLLSVSCLMMFVPHDA